MLLKRYYNILLQFIFQKHIEFVFFLLHVLKFRTAQWRQKQIESVGGGVVVSSEILTSSEKKILIPKIIPRTPTFLYFHFFFKVNLGTSIFAARKGKGGG